MKLQSIYRKLHLSRLAKRTLLTAASCLVYLAALPQGSAEPTEIEVSLITAPYKLNNDFDADNLRNWDMNRRYHTPNEKNDDGSVKENIGEQYLEVTLNAPLDLASDEDLVVAIQRCFDCDERQPTVFRVEGQEEGKEWEHFCYIYYLYRGKSTIEYSARIRPQIKTGQTTEPKYKKLRFYVTANNSRSYDLKGNHAMGLAALKLYKVKRDGYYPNDMADQFHLRTDYKRDYENYEFVNTMGWLDSRNRDYAKTRANTPCEYNADFNPYNNEAHAKGTLAYQQAEITKLNNWATWGSDWSSTGEWRLNNEELLDLGVQMPEMGLITNDKDFENGSTHKVQPTHVTEHILYALPGDPIILTPYYAFADAKHYEKYEVNFAHWYDYRTGDKIEYDDGKGNKTNLLDFIADPWAVCISNNNGFYGAYLLCEKEDKIPHLKSQNYGMSATFFCPRDPFHETGEPHSLPFRACDKKIAGNANDIDEFVIAADFSQSFNRGRNLIKEDGKDKIIEPNIAFRHIFRIRDGKELADSLSGSEKANKAYIERNRRYVTARAGKPFQIGLDISVPRPINKDGRWRSIPSEYYYKISNTDYRRINAMRLRVTKEGGSPEDISNQDCFESGKTFYFAEEYKGLGYRNINDVKYAIAGGSVFTADVKVFTDDEDGTYYRMLRSDKGLRGRYKVEIIGQEMIRQDAPTDIHIIGTDTPLVVMEYIIDYVDNEEDENPKAILVTADQLYNKDNVNNDKYEYARPEVMTQKYGQYKDRIDFDYYRGLESLGTANEYLDLHTATKDGKEYKHYKFKWPAAWEKSNYANGYSNAHNYNMYVVANHSSQTPYHNKWHDNPDHKDDETVGLYDRLNDQTTRQHAVDPSVEVQNGYFLYVNAASDPGVMVTLNVDNLCTGSTVHVSAWVSEFSRMVWEDNQWKVLEKANLVFNFVAVLKNTGDRIPIHSYVSGYVLEEQTGQWMNINYSFTPDIDHIGYTASQIDHYELELENNCKSSDGADYAIDDIAIYIVSPVVSAEQVSPLCTDVEGGATNLVRIETPFTETLQSIDVAEVKDEAEGEPLKLEYLILDRAKFDAAYEKALKDGKDNPGYEAFIADGVRISSGEVSFTSNADKLDEYTLDADENEARRRTDDRAKMLAFNTNFGDKHFKIGKEYYISLHVSKTTDPTGSVTESETNEGSEESEGTGESVLTQNYWAMFDIKDPCAKSCIFKVKGKNNIRVDGEIRAQDGEISVCEGESPKIEIEIATKNDNPKEYLSAVCDWFKGTREEYDAIKEDGVSLSDAMTAFREYYPNVETPNDESVVDKNSFSKERLSFLRKYVEENPDKLIFSQTSYTFPAIMIPEGEDTADDVVLVLPIPIHQNEEGDTGENPQVSDMTVCTAPMEIKIHADLHSPKLVHGLSSGITYPDDMGNVPLRIGLDQLKKVTVDNTVGSGDVETDGEGSAAASQALLVIPIRKVETSGVVTKVQGMSRLSDDILLESTTDPNYDTDPLTVTSESGEVYLVQDKTVAGEIRSFRAKVTDSQSGTATDNSLGAVFNKSFTFREGYEYTFSYRFKEVVPAAEKDTKLCDGRTFFTIKVVPEYLVWNGSEGSRNWNNDDNWQRVSSGDLYADASDAAVGKRLYAKVTDGENKKVGAYMPMAFTKVIVPEADETVLPPYMYSSAYLRGVESVAAETPADAYAEGADDSSTGNPTENIQYDMVAEVAEDEGANVECGLWYANTCEQIHFRPRATIMNQQYLTYQKAWIDLELDPYRWYTLAMPLRKVFAGEFYLPSANGRQETELFQGITFDTKVNNRFKPAVFQRGWDKSVATNYKPDGSTADAVIKANWSHVYNDVKESYGSGTGFSIKVDMTAVNADKPQTVDDAEGSESNSDKVLFRLPKADEYYDYYDHEGNLIITSDRKTISHKEDEEDLHYKLNPTSGKITAVTAGESYFLVGNPFMTYLDMAQFLTANSEKIEPKYWLITSSTQKAAVFDETAAELKESGEGFVGDAPRYVAPMQGFFVKAIDKVTTLELDYDVDMMVDESTATSSVVLRTRSAAADGWSLTVSAENEGTVSSTATLIVAEEAAEASLPVLDNSDLEVRATVYTVGQGKALSVNRLAEIERVELGVIALPEEETVLRFNVDDASAGVMLYDAESDSYTTLYDDMTYTVKGNAAGRLFLTSVKAVEAAQSSQISWSSEGQEVTVNSSVEGADGVAVRVYDYAGRCVAAQTSDGQEVRFRVAPGVYVLEAEAGSERLCVQIKI